MAIVLATGGVGCTTFCDECDDFPIPGGPGGYALMPGSYAGGPLSTAPDAPPTGSPILAPGTSCRTVLPPAPRAAAVLLPHQLPQQPLLVKTQGQTPPRLTPPVPHRSPQAGWQPQTSLHHHPQSLPLVDFQTPQPVRTAPHDFVAHDRLDAHRRAEIAITRPFIYEKDFDHGKDHTWPAFPGFLT